MTVAVDTNILLDILLPDPNYKESSLNLLTRYMKTDQLIISEVVYSELASQFPEEKLLINFLDDTGINLIGSSSSALWIAATTWKKYIKVSGKALQCNNCGKEEIFKCSGCYSIITCRLHIISDFLIAGHALVESDKLLTRDRGFYRTYFPELITESGTGC